MSLQKTKRWILDPKRVEGRDAAVSPSATDERPAAGPPSVHPLHNSALTSRGITRIFQADDLMVGPVRLSRVVADRAAAAAKQRALGATRIMPVETLLVPALARSHAQPEPPVLADEGSYCVPPAPGWAALLYLWRQRRQARLVVGLISLAVSAALAIQSGARTPSSAAAAAERRDPPARATAESVPSAGAPERAASTAPEPVASTVLAEPRRAALASLRGLPPAPVAERSVVPAAAEEAAEVVTSSAASRERPSRRVRRSAHGGARQASDHSARRAADALAAGDYARAAASYEALSMREPRRAVYREAARILRARLVPRRM